MGAWCVEGKESIRDIVKKLKLKTGDVKSTLYLIQKISTAVQKGNAVSILSPMPTNEGLDGILKIVFVLQYLFIT